MSESRYQWLKSHGICVQCGQRDAFSGHVRCPECIEKANVASAKCWEDEERRKKYETHGNERHKQLYRERKEKHLCVGCGKRLPDSYNFVLCDRCRARRNMLKRTGVACGEKFRERMEQGVCMYCGDEIVPGYKFCERHLEQIRGTIKKANVKSSVRWRKEIGRQCESAKAKNLYHTSGN